MSSPPQLLHMLPNLTLESLPNLSYLSTGNLLCSPALMTRKTCEGGDGGGGREGMELPGAWYCCLGWKLVSAVGRDTRYLVWRYGGMEVWRDEHAWEVEGLQHTRVKRQALG